MAGFRTHITTSTVIGVGYAAAGHLFLHAPWSTCVLAGGLCSVSGMLPDLDSDSGVPVRETMTFAAAVIPMLMMDRFEQIGFEREAMVAAGVVVYLAVRFGVAEIFKRYTVHRGMWHSIPAALIAGLLAFLVMSDQDMTLRVFKTSAVVLGFMSHLVVDEIWSISMKGGRIRFKKSSGTALKFWGKNGWANLSAYAKLLILSLLAVGDPVMMEHFDFHTPMLPRMAQQLEPEPTAPFLRPYAPPPIENDPVFTRSLEERLKDAVRY